MRAYKLRFMFYSIKADSREAAVRKAVALIAADPEGFVISAQEEDANLLKRIVTGK